MVKRGWGPHVASGWQQSCTLIVPVHKSVVILYTCHLMWSYSPHGPSPFALHTVLAPATHWARISWPHAAHGSEWKTVRSNCILWVTAQPTLFCKTSHLLTQSDVSQLLRSAQMPCLCQRNLCCLTGQKTLQLRSSAQLCPCWEKPFQATEIQFGWNDQQIQLG